MFVGIQLLIHFPIKCLILIVFFANSSKWENSYKIIGYFRKFANLESWNLYFLLYKIKYKYLVGILELQISELIHFGTSVIQYNRSDKATYKNRFSPYPILMAAMVPLYSTYYLIGAIYSN